MPNRNRVQIDEIKGDAVFVVAPNEPPEIPDGLGRDCPQCKRVAWAHSRWCWNCAFDFDRASIPKVHPVKLLWAVLLINSMIALSTGWLAMGSYLDGR